jgi:hypothetical protein
MSLPTCEFVANPGEQPVSDRSLTTCRVKDNKKRSETI